MTVKAKKNKTKKGGNYVKNYVLSRRIKTDTEIRTIYQLLHNIWENGKNQNSFGTSVRKSIIGI